MATWDAAFEADPAGTDNANTVDDDLATLKGEIRARLDLEHNFSVIGHASEDGSHVDEFLKPLYVKEGLLVLTHGHEGHTDLVTVTGAAWTDYYTFYSVFHADLSASKLMGYIQASVDSGVTMETRLYNVANSLVLAGVATITDASGDWATLAAGVAVGDMADALPQDLTIQARITAGSPNGYLSRPIIYFEAS